MSKTYLEFLKPYEKKLCKKIKKKGLTITVSGSSGSGKSTGAKSIAKAFKLKYITAGEIQRKIAEEKGLTLEEQVKRRGKKVDYEMDKRTLEFAMKGNVIIDARLSGWAAGDYADVKIFYDCPLKTRAERIAKRDKISFEDALKNVKKRDEEDNKKYKKLYGIDLFDKSIYDFIIDNRKLTKKQAEDLPVKLVKKFLKKRKLTIAISGPPGSGTTTIAKKLAKKFRLSYFSLGKKFKDYSKEKESKAALEVWKTIGKKRQFHKNLDKIQMEKAKKGNVVICGKLSIAMLKNLVNYKIWIESPLKTRAKRVAKRDRLPFEQALKEIKEREKIERKEWKRIYGFDYFNQKKDADLVLDNSDLNVEQTADRILKFIKSKH